MCKQRCLRRAMTIKASVIKNQICKFLLPFTAVIGLTVLILLYVLSVKLIEYRSPFNYSVQLNDGRVRFINNALKREQNGLKYDSRRKESLVLKADHRIQESPLKIQLDKYRRSAPLWKNDRECDKFLVRFAKSKTFPKCSLVSFPGSGNTWLRHLIEAASGLFTGSIYNDGQLYLWGYYGELDPWDVGTTIVQKSHNSAKDSVLSFEGRGILLMRNPYRAILSFHNFLFAGHHLYAPMLNYRRKDWPPFVHLQTKLWVKTVMNWVTEGKKIHIVHYENLYENPVGELKKILKFLNVPENKERLNCIQKSNFTRFRRFKKHFTESLTIFPNKTRDKLDRAIRYASYLLEKHGYEEPPLGLYEFYNGTSSEITFVPCGKNESLMDCDERVDQLNFESRPSRVSGHQSSFKELLKLANTELMAELSELDATSKPYRKKGQLMKEIYEAK